MDPPFSMGHVTSSVANENRTQPVLVVSYSAMILAQAPESWAPSTP